MTRRPRLFRHIWCEAPPHTQRPRPLLPSMACASPSSAHLWESPPTSPGGAWLWLQAGTRRGGQRLEGASNGGGGGAGTKHAGTAQGMLARVVAERVPHGGVPAPPQRWGSGAQRLPGRMLGAPGDAQRCACAGAPLAKLLCQGRAGEGRQGRALCQHSLAPRAAVPLHGHSQELSETSKHRSRTNKSQEYLLHIKKSYMFWVQTPPPGCHTIPGRIPPCHQQLP